MPKLDQSRVDKELMDLKEKLENPNLTAAQLEVAAEGALLRALVVTTVFKKRFPVEHARWEEQE